MKEKKGSCQFLLKWLTANVCLPRKCVRTRQDQIVLTGPSTSVQGYYAWSIIYDVRTLNMSPRRTKPTILQCMYDQQRLRSVCASTHYIKQAPWIALSPQTVHTVWSSKGLILGGEGPIYGIVRMCVSNSPLFQHCQVYDWPPFFNKKYMNGPIFLVSFVKGPFFWHPGICTCFSLRDFSRLLILLVLHELTVIFVCVTTSKKVGTKKSKNRSTF